ncbi:unnamed protein product [Musa textilis]
MYKVRSQEAKVCSRFSMLLGPKGCSGSCIGEESQSSRCICGGRTVHRLFSKTK